MVAVDNPFLGTWHIIEMETWAPDAFNLLGQANLKFDNKGMGRFQFIAVIGFMDCEYSERDGKPLVEFSWQGNDERDETNGRGWAIMENNMTMTGHIFIHCSEDSEFIATRA